MVNRYAPWRYILLLIVIGVAAVYATPNLYGEDPAVQISHRVDLIGAGIGGLIAANLLAKKGLKVLLVEQHYVVGGYCSTFQRKGYTFDAASHFYPLLGDGETMTGRLLSEIGCETKWAKMDPVDQFHLPDGSCFSVSADC